MHKIDAAGNNNGQFVARNATEGTPGTLISADWLNAMQNEVSGVITGTGVALDKTKHNQLATAIAKMIDDKISAASSGVSEARVIELIKENAVIWS